MRVTKTVIKTYDVKFFLGTLDFTFGEFKRIRQKSNSMKVKFERCFCCGHRFKEDETPVVISVSGKGNLFACNECLKKSKQIPKHILTIRAFSSVGQNSRLISG